MAGEKSTSIRVDNSRTPLAADRISITASGPRDDPHVTISVGGQLVNLDVDEAFVVREAILEALPKDRR